jgi:hypothetical protein
VSDNRASQSNNEAEYNRPIVAELCRMVWLIFGPVGILFSAAAIWKHAPWTYSVLDGVLWGLAMLTLVARFIDIRLFRGKTTEDQPATMADFWRYAAKVMLFAVVVWGLAQSLQA